MKFFSLSGVILIVTLFSGYFYSQTSDLLISEYGEGSSGNSKFIELFNGTGAPIDLSDYELQRVTNGGTWPEVTLALSGTLADGATYVVAHNNSDTPGADLYSTSFCTWNGDDAVGLASSATSTLIDVIGDENTHSDPGTDWNVGTSGETRNDRLTRKPTICSPNSDWDASRGTTDANSEWTYVTYSTGAANAGHTSSCTACTAPTVQATTFGSSSINFTSGTVSWTRGNGNAVMVVVQEGSPPFADPSNGTTYSANSVFGSGDGLGGGFVVYNGTGTSVNITNLNSGTDYYIVVYEYNSTGTCYLLPELSGNFSTLEISNDSDIIPVATSESATVPSTTTTSGPLTSVQGVQVWEFEIRDGGSSTDTDNLPTILDDLVITQATGNQMNDWSVAIQSADLFDGATHLGSAAITTNTLTFTGLNATAADNSSKIISLRISLNCPAGGSGNIDGDDFGFRILNSNVTEAASSTSGFNGSFTNCFSANGSNVYDVTATQLTFTQQPTTTALNNTMSPSVVVSAVDACGNTDEDATGNVTIISTGTLLGSSTTVVALSSGEAAFSNLIHNAVGTSLTLDASHGSYATITSGIFDIPVTTSFERGDFAIVAVNTQRRASGSADEVCFITFKNISPGTSFEITDNGYERVSAGEWGNTEGTVKFIRNLSASTITAGSVICIEGPDNSVYGGDGLDYFDIYVCGVKDDANWTAASQTDKSIGSMDWNGSDQVWIMQGGNWIHNTNNGHDDTYTGGNILYGWTATPWETTPGFASTAGSTFINGMDCYATEVSGISDNDKVKYKGPKSGSKFELLANINDPSNWQGYADNTAYDAEVVAYDYLNEPCTTTGFTVTPSSGAGVWTGTISEDWFYCANWDDFTVPDATVNVTISQEASNNCQVASVTDTARCASIDLSSNNNVNNDLEIAATGVLEVGGDITVTKSAGSGEIILSLTSDGELSFDNISIDGTAVSSNNAILRNESALSLLDIDGNLTINNGGFVDLNNTGTINLAGDWNNNHNTGAFDEIGSTIILDGGANQNINTNNFNETFHDLTLSKTGGYVILQDNITIDASGTLNINDDQLDLNTKELSIDNPLSTAISRSSGSIVEESGSAAGNNDGKINWNIGTTLGAHIFPFSTSIGGDYIPFEFDLTAGDPGIVSISTYHTPGTNLPWPASPEDVTNLNSTAGLTPDNRDATADRFWQINTSETGTPVADLTFSYMTSELPIAPYNDHLNIIAQRYNTTLDQWDLTIFPGQTRGTITGGYFVKVPSISSFSPWALASISSPLPAELTHFIAKEKNGSVALNWETTSEINTAYFVVERSKDGIKFHPILSKEAAGNSSSNLYYTDFDYNPLDGESFYRLLTFDLNGSSKMSNIEKVNIENNNIGIATFDNSWQILSDNLSKDVSISIYDSQGKLIQNYPIQLVESNNMKIDNSFLPSGVYFINLTGNTISQSIKVIK